MTHSVICCRIEASGDLVCVYLPGRSDIEMNANLRSMFRFSNGLKVERSLVDHNMEVWYDLNERGAPFNIFSQLLIGKSARGVLVVTTRNPKFRSTTSFEQQFIDIDWDRINLFLKDSRSPSPTTQGTQQQVQPVGAQQHRPYGLSLSKVSNNTSQNMGTSFSGEQQRQEPTAVAFAPVTQPAFVGEGAFSYKRPPVHKILPDPKKEEEEEDEESAIGDLLTLSTFGFPEKVVSSQEQMDHVMKQEEQEDEENDEEEDLGVKYKTRKVVINDERVGKVVLKIKGVSPKPEEKPQVQEKEEEEQEEEEEDSVLGQMMMEEDDDENEDHRFVVPSPPRERRRRSTRIRNKKRGRERHY